MQALTGLMTKIGPWANLGMGVLGTVSNFRANAERNKLYQAALARQRYLESLTPAKHSEGIMGFRRPLSGGLTAGITNLVQSAMGERGLAQAPGIFSEVLAQALAPYEQQDLDRATQSWFRSLGTSTPSDYAAIGSLSPQGGSTVNLWRSILDSFRKPSAFRSTVPWPRFPSSSVPMEPTPPFMPGSSEPTLPDWWSWFNPTAPNIPAPVAAGDGGYS